MLEGLPIMLALCFMLWHAYYAQNYASIIDAGLVVGEYIDRLCEYINKKMRMRICNNKINQGRIQDFLKGGQNQEWISVEGGANPSIVSLKLGGAAPRSYGVFKVTGYP